jgi:membrane protease subunit HflC
MRRAILAFALVLALGVGLVAAGNLGLGPLVVTREDEQKIILFLSQARRVTQPGVSLRWPLLETEVTYSRRWLYLNTEPDTVQTRDGEQLRIDNYAIWRIEDPMLFQRAFPGVPEGMRQAADRIDRAVRDDLREVIGRHTLAEVLDRERSQIMREAAGQTRSTLAAFGVGIADVRINQTELPEGTEESVYARMKTERERLARKSRAEGEERARRIRADADREATVIVAEAKRDAEIARGVGDAEATRIYGEAYASDPQFYAFQRTLEAYRKTIGAKTTLVLSPDSEFFRFLEGEKR